MDEREAWQELTGICAAFPEHERAARMWFERSIKECGAEAVGWVMRSFRRTLDTGELIRHPESWLDAVMRGNEARKKQRAELAKKGMSPSKWWRKDGHFRAFKERTILEARAKLMGRPLTEEEKAVSLRPEEGPITEMPEECKEALRRLGVKILERSPF